MELICHAEHNEMVGVQNLNLHGLATRFLDSEKIIRHLNSQSVSALVSSRSIEAPRILKAPPCLSDVSEGGICSGS